MCSLGGFDLEHSGILLCACCGGKKKKEKKKKKREKKPKPSPLLLHAQWNRGKAAYTVADLNYIHHVLIFFDRQVAESFRFFSMSTLERFHRVHFTGCTVLRPAARVSEGL